LSSSACSGKCVGIPDGDTITVLQDGKEQIRIRLCGINCPEKGLAFATKAKQFTSGLVFGKIIEIKHTDTDWYGRTVAWVYVGSRCVNEELLKAGLAWHYKRYSKDRNLAAFEKKARQRKIGLWRDPHHVPLWVWRKKLI
jgi:endonuclease YncB( thermonuclease family)